MNPADLSNALTPAQSAMQPMASPTAPTPASTDFLLMLGQLLGESAPLPPPATPTASLQAEVKSDVAESAATTDQQQMLAAMLPLPITPLAPPLPAASASEGATSDERPIDVLQSRAQLSATTANSTLLFEAASEQVAADTLPTLESPSFATVAAEAHPRATQSAETASARPIQTPVGSQAWADEVGARVTLMAEQGRQTASLRLSPEHLGPLEIRIAINDDQASVWFGAAHADTRAAIEHALPRLREMFAAQGMALTDAGVFHEPPREHPMPQTKSGGALDAHHEEPQTPATIRLRSALIDAYA